MFSVDVDILSISIDNRPARNSGLISYLLLRWYSTILTEPFVAILLCFSAIFLGPSAKKREEAFLVPGRRGVGNGKLTRDKPILNVLLLLDGVR